MKKHAIIPVFISHRGCPNDCVFCNQKKITARQGDVTPEDAENTINEWYSTLSGMNLETIELAFYGGSFTGIPIEEQNGFLEVARRFKERGIIDKIHLSTRPDYINEEILDNLKRYKVDVIELGVQSFDDRILRKANRGHNADIVYKSCELIKQYGFTLGIQLMIGLPGDTEETCVFSAQETVKIKPQLARLYPVVIIEDTELLEMYRRGDYVPFTHDESVEITTKMYRILDDAGINIIRVGLKSTDLINTSSTEGDTYHPAFRQLVEGKIAWQEIAGQLKKLNIPPQQNLTAEIRCNPHDTSNAAGNGGCNKKKLAELYPHLRIRIMTDENLSRNKYVVKIINN